MIFKWRLIELAVSSLIMKTFHYLLDLLVAETWRRGNERSSMTAVATPGPTCN